MKSPMMSLLSVTAFTALALLAVLPAGAHHSFAAEFDSKKPVELKGVVTKVEWMNPHIYFYLDVKAENGQTVNYAVEGGTPNSLRRLGWGKDSLRVGDQLSVAGFRAKNGSNTINARTVLLPDGTRLLAGSSYDSGGGEK